MSQDIPKKLLNLTTEVIELSADSKYLQDINDNFYYVSEKYPNLKNIISFVESIPTNLFGAGKSLDYIVQYMLLSNIL
jgi:hypothetical protein